MTDKKNLKNNERELVILQFDGEYYHREYPDIRVSKEKMVEHYCAVGWREGRNPHGFFDTVSYLQEYQDIAKLQINPFYHYLDRGFIERRVVRVSVTPSRCTRLLFGYPICDWVGMLAPHVDVDHYRSQLGGRLPREVNPVAHFAYRGWREGFSPSRGSDIGQLLDEYPIAGQLWVNPLLVHLEATAGGFVLIKMPPGANRTAAVDPAIELAASEERAAVSGAVAGFGPGADALGTAIDHVLDQGNATKLTSAGNTEEAEIAAIRPAFSTDYYIATYPDVVAAAIDPLMHYYYTGWREGRNPSRHFYTQYYLKSNDDVRHAGVNPLWHFVVEGQSQGRRTRPAGGYRREVIDAALEPARRSEAYAKDTERLLSGSAMTRLLTTRLKGKTGLILSLSHDRYTEVVGGTQILISDEQRTFNSRKHGYLHLSPQNPLLTLAPDNPDFAVRLILDGRLLGCFLLRDLCDLLKARPATVPQTALFTVHCLFGFSPAGVCALWSAAKPARSLYWLHDYSSVCEGFNLLRNDVAFCGGPEVSSAACGICVYGGRRAIHLAGMRRVFQHCRFDVVSPSEFTRALWEQASNLPRKSLVVHPHWTLSSEPRSVPGKRGALPTGPIPVAFVGSPTPHKGWPIFTELATAIENDSRYELYHLVERGMPTLPGMRVVQTEVTPNDRDATVRLLKEHGIEMLALLSPWPETFSFVAHEALLANAEIVCLADSGNVAALVTATGAGVVLPSAEAVVEFFTSGAAVAHVRRRDRPRRDYYVAASQGSASMAKELSRSERA